MYRLHAIGKRGVLFSTDAIPGCITNLYLIKGRKSNYLIDTGLGSGTAEFVKNHILQNCPNDTVVINTHYHWDHIWGNIGFEGNMIIAHTRTNEMINVKWDEMELKCGKWKEGHIKKVLPNTLIDDRFTFPEDELEVFYTPGHTGDSLSIYDHIDKVLHVGDNIETLEPEIYDSKENLINSLSRYLEFDFTYSVSGHNDHIKREDIEKVLEGLSSDKQ